MLASQYIPLTLATDFSVTQADSLRPKEYSFQILPVWLTLWFPVTVRLPRLWCNPRRRFTHSGGSVTSYIITLKPLLWLHLRRFFMHLSCICSFALLSHASFIPHSPWRVECGASRLIANADGDTSQVGKIHPYLLNDAEYRSRFPRLAASQLGEIERKRQQIELILWTKN